MSGLDLFWPIVVAILAIIIFLLIGDRIGRSSERRSHRREWQEGKDRVFVNFTSIWDEQQREFTKTVQGLERQINDRMLAAIQKSKDESDPILKDLSAMLERLEKTNPTQGRALPSTRAASNPTGPAANS